MEQPRDKEQRFDLKGDEPRIMRSMRLTDKCWETLGRVATESEVSRADLIEVYAMRLDQAESIDKEQVQPMPDIYTLQSLRTQILANPDFTRGGKDAGAVRRALDEFISLLACGLYPS